MDTVFPVETSQRPDPHSDESQPMDLTRFPPEVRDFVRAEQKKYGLVTDGHPNAALLDRMGVQRTPQ